MALLLCRVLLQSPDDAVHPGLVWGSTELVTPQCGEHNSRHSAAILDEEVAKGSDDIPWDGALSYRQAAVFRIVGTTQSRGGAESQQAEGQKCSSSECHGGRTEAERQ